MCRVRRFMDGYDLAGRSWEESGLARRLEERLALCGDSERAALEFFTGGQLFLQSLLEYLLVLDRVLFLRGSGAASVGVRELFDPMTSPRNKVLVCQR